MPGSTSKRGHNRLVYYQYPHLFTDPVPTATEHLLLEITAFGEPEPYNKRRLISYLGQYLLDHGQSEVVRKYGLRRHHRRALQPKAFAPRPTASTRGQRCAPNLLLDQPKPTQANRVWVSDST